MKNNPLITFLQLTRFPLALTAATDSVAGYLLTAARPDVSKLLLFAGSSFCLYSGGVALNDVVDSDRDKTLHPGRPIPSGRVNKNIALVIANILLIAGVLLATLTSRFGFFCGIAIANLIVSYNYGTKHLGIIGALNMGLTRGLNLLMGGIEIQSSTLFICSGILAIYVFFLTFLSLLEEKRNIIVYKLLIVFISIDLIAINFFKLHYLTLPITLILSLLFFERITKCNSRGEIMNTVKNGVLIITAFDAAIIFSSGNIYLGFTALVLFSFLYLFKNFVKT